jgi:hypothetical protein
MEPEGSLEPALVYILSQMNPIHIFPPLFL